MRKSIITISTATAIVLGGSLFTNTVQAEPSLQDIKNKRTEVQADLSKAESKLAEVMLEIEEIKAEINQLEEALNENQKALDKVKDAIGKSKEEIEKLEAEIKELEENIEKRNEILKERLAAYQQSGGHIGTLDFVFGTSSPVELTDRISKVTTITESDMQLIEEQEADQAKLEEKQDQVEEKLAEQEDQKAEIEEIKAVMTAQKDEAAEQEKSLEAKEDELNQLAADLQAEDNNLAAAESRAMAAVQAQLELQRQAQAQAVASTSSNNGDANSNNGSSNSNNGSSNSNNGGSSNSGSNDVSIPSGDGGGSFSTTELGSTTYVFGAQNPAAGQFDCSGYVQWEMGKQGVNLPRNTDGQVGAGKAVSASDMKPGDLVFFDTYKKNGHVGIYLGNGKFKGSQSSTGVAVADMSSGYWKDKFSGTVRRVK